MIDPLKGSHRKSESIARQIKINPKVCLYKKATKEEKTPGLGYGVPNTTIELMVTPTRPTNLPFISSL